MTKKPTKILMWLTVIFICATGGLFLRVSGGFLFDPRSSVYEEMAIINLGTLRSSLSIYYGDNNFYPISLNVLSANGKYLGTIPSVNLTHTEKKFGLSVPPHADSAQFHVMHQFEPNDRGGWGYVYSADGSDRNGKVFINCTHKTMSGKRWCDY